MIRLLTFAALAGTLAGCSQDMTLTGTNLTAYAEATHTETEVGRLEVDDIRPTVGVRLTWTWKTPFK